MELRPSPAGLTQLAKSRKGELIPIEDDVQNVVNGLHEIDPGFRVRYSEAGEYFAVYYKPPEWDEGDGYLVTTAQELDQRIVKLVEALHWKVLKDPTYSYADELEAEEARQRKEAADKYLEENAEAFAQLAFAMRKDLGYDKTRIFVPKGESDGK